MRIHEFDSIELVLKEHCFIVEKTKRETQQLVSSMRLEKQMMQQYESKKSTQDEPKNTTTTVRLVSMNPKKSMTFRIFNNDPFEKIIKVFASETAYQPSEYVLKLDGIPVKHSSTPEELGIVGEIELQVSLPLSRSSSSSIPSNSSSSKPSAPSVSSSKAINLDDDDEEYGLPIQKPAPNNNSSKPPTVVEEIKDLIKVKVRMENADKNAKPFGFKIGQVMISFSHTLPFSNS